MEVSQNAAPPTIDMQKILKERIREPWKETSSERDREAVLLTSTDPRNLEAGCHHQMLSKMLSFIHLLSKYCIHLYARLY